MSGLPAANSNCAWCACNVRAGPVPVGHHLNLPFDNRFVASQNPWPSYCKMRMAVPLRDRKVNS